MGIEVLCNCFLNFEFSELFYNNFKSEKIYKKKQL